MFVVRSKTVEKKFEYEAFAVRSFAMAHFRSQSRSSNVEPESNQFEEIAMFEVTSTTNPHTAVDMVKLNRCSFLARQRPRLDAAQLNVSTVSALDSV